MTPPSPDKPLNIDPTRQPAFRHRSGWAFALEALAPLHDPTGALFDSYMERTFGWMEREERERGRIPYREPWIGIFHNPPDVPRWHSIDGTPQAILRRPAFRESLPHCVGLFALSEHLGRWLSRHVSVPVGALIHPTETPDVRFDPQAFLDNPEPAVIQIGWWLRRLASIYRLEAGPYRKAMLAVAVRHFKHALRRDRNRTPLTQRQLDSVTTIPFVPDAEYDRLLSKNVVFCDLIASSANNLIIECIVRNTPLLINRLPAVEEYLGRDYPFYFSSFDEAAAKLAHVGTVLDAHEYLRNLPKEQFSQRYFRDAVRRSEAVRGLGDRSAGLPGSSRITTDAASLVKGGEEITLTLRRTASGEVHVEQVVCPPSDGGVGRQACRDLQRLLCGVPLSTARRMTQEDVDRHVGRGGGADAGRTYRALRAALDRLSF